MPGHDAVCSLASDPHVVCPSVPGWLAPAVVVAGLGVLLTFLFNIYNARRAGIKERRDNAIDPLLDKFSTRISIPLLGALQEFEVTGTECKIGFRQFRTDTSEDGALKRSKFASEFQLNTVEPARIKLIGALQKADQYDHRANGEAWTKLEDSFEDIYTIMNTLQSTDIINIENLDRLILQFSSAINQTSTNINDEIDNYKKMILDRNQFGLMGLYLKK